jgi:hypothetical protein
MHACIWYIGFKRRNNVSMRRPSKLTDVRARQSKKEVIDDFFAKLKQVYDKHHLSDQAIYNMDETGTYIYIYITHITSYHYSMHAYAHILLGYAFIHCMYTYIY